MATKRVISWLGTERGRGFSFFLATASSVGVFLSYALPNTFCIEEYRDIVRLYKTGLSVPLSSTLKERFKKALDIVEVPEADRMHFQPFHVFGFDLFSAGTKYSRFGCIIGLPINFTYKDRESIEKQSINVNGKSIPYGLDEANDLLDSLVLSEKAQVFAMAREIKMILTPKLLIDGGFATLSIMYTYGFAHYINTKLNMLMRPLSLRLVFYTLLCSFTAGNYILAKDFSQVYYEQEIDKELKEKHPDLAEGGKEFYSQMLKRNVALRKLMGKEGESMYTALGNEHYFLRQRHLPLLQRRDIFLQKPEAVAEKM